MAAEQSLPSLVHVQNLKGFTSGIAHVALFSANSICRKAIDKKIKKEICRKDIVLISLTVVSLCIKLQTDISIATQLNFWKFLIELINKK